MLVLAIVALLALGVYAWMIASTRRLAPAAEAGLFCVDQVPVDSPAYAEENGSQQRGDAQ